MPARRGDISQVAWLGAVKPFIGLKKGERWRRKPHEHSPVKSGTKMHVQTCYTDSPILWKGNLAIYHPSLRFALGALTRQAPPCESSGYKGILKKSVIGKPLLEQHLKASNCNLYSLGCIAQRGQWGKESKEEGSLRVISALLNVLSGDRSDCESLLLKGRQAAYNVFVWPLFQSEKQ